MIRRPPRSTLFPYTTLFRSLQLVDEHPRLGADAVAADPQRLVAVRAVEDVKPAPVEVDGGELLGKLVGGKEDRKSTRLNSSHANISYAVFCLKKKKNQKRSMGSELWRATNRVTGHSLAYRLPCDVESVRTVRVRLHNAPHAGAEHAGLGAVPP